MKSHRDFLRETLKVYPRHASVALWRAVELRLLSQVAFPEPILDVGCGEGEIGRLLFGTSSNVTGIDADQKVLRLAEKTGAYRLTVRGDASRMPFPDQSFASLLCNCVLEHIPDDEAVVREMGRVARPGATVAITVPAPGLKHCLYVYNSLLQQGREEEADEYLDLYDRMFGHLHYRSGNEWNDMLGRAGFESIRIAPYLAAPAVAIWNRLDTFLMEPIRGVKSYPKLAAYAAMPECVRVRLMYHLLRKYYLRDVAPGEPHGCWFIVGRKMA